MKSENNNIKSQHENSNDEFNAKIKALEKKISEREAELRKFKIEH